MTALPFDPDLPAGTLCVPLVFRRRSARSAVPLRPARLPRMQFAELPDALPARSAENHIERWIAAMLQHRV